MTCRVREALKAILGSVLSRRNGVWPSLACLLTLACLMLAGCTGGSGEKPKVSNSAQDSDGSTGQNESVSPKSTDQNTALLDNVRDSLDLNKLGFSTDLQFVLSMLNQWHDSQVAEIGDKANTGVALPPGILAKIRPDQTALLNSPVYMPEDGLYLRDCVTARKIGAYAVGNARNDLARAVKLFQYVIRSVRLSPNHLGWLPLQPGQKVDIPLTQYDLCVLGQGTARDRAWVFSSLLRQLGIDTVVIFPEPPPGQSQLLQGNFLVGVILGQQVYLFDPQNGVPIPAPAGTVNTPEKPSVATFEQAVTHPELFRQLDPIPSVAIYAIQGESLRKPGVYLIGTTSMWSAKMKRLQPQFSGKDALIVYEELADNQGKPGLLSRVGKAGGKYWNADSLQFWPYPQFQMSMHLQMQPPLQDLYDRLQTPLQAPFLWEFNEKERQIEIVKPKQKPQEKRAAYVPQLRDARLAHLNGGFDFALKIYNDVRIQARNHPFSKHAPQKNSPPPVVRESGQDATFLINYGIGRSNDDATYFTGMCQFDQGNYRASAETLRKYLAGYAQKREQMELLLQQNAQRLGMARPDQAMQRDLQQALVMSYFWVSSARLTLALALAELGQKTEAARTLQAVQFSNSQFVGYLHLMRQFDPSIAAEVQQELLKQYNEFRARQQAEMGIVPDEKGTIKPAVPPKNETKPPAKKPDDKPPAAATAAPKPATPPAAVPVTPPSTTANKETDKSSPGKKAPESKTGSEGKSEKAETKN